jgi:peptidoglycan/LPS O-acetylase OafA/YrhL
MSVVFTLYLSPFCALFLLGCLIGELYRKRTIVWPWAWLAFGLGISTLIGWVNARWFDGNLLLGYYTPARVLLYSAAACGFVLWSVGLDQKGQVVLPRACLVLGGSSYALYLSHTLWLQWLYDVGVQDWLARNGLTIPGYWLAALAIIVMSAAFYQFAERPLHRGFRRVLRV